MTNNSLSANTSDNIDTENSDKILINKKHVDKERVKVIIKKRFLIKGFKKTEKELEKKIASSKVADYKYELLVKELIEIKKCLSIIRNLTFKQIQDIINFKYNISDIINTYKNI